MFKEFLTEAQRVKVKHKKYLEWPDGSLTSLDSDTAVIVRDGSYNDGKLYIYKGLPYLDTNKYDKTFKNLEDVAKYLSKENFEYIGIDDI